MNIYNYLDLNNLPDMRAGSLFCHNQNERDGFCNVCVNSEICAYREIVKLANEYRWHDLYDNPEDLPELGSRVEVVLVDKKTGEIKDNYITYYGIRSPISGNYMKIWNPPYNYCFYSNEIRAWRKIEKYKPLEERNENTNQ